VQMYEFIFYISKKNKLFL